MTKTILGQLLLFIIFVGNLRISQLLLQILHFNCKIVMLTEKFI